MSKLALAPVFVETKNVRAFKALMAGLDLAAGEGRFGMVWGRAGRGKTKTSQWYAANNGGIYLRMLKIWRTSELDFLKTLCRELGEREIPYRKGPCHNLIVDRLLSNPQPVFVDEIEKLPALFLEVLRDLADMTGAPFIVIGEEALTSAMRRDRRVWSRTFQQVEFGPIAQVDIIYYARDAAGISLTREQSDIFHTAAGGDWRIVKRDFAMLVKNMNAAGVTVPDDKLISQAVKAGLRGK